VADLRRRVVDLWDENCELREVADDQARQLEELNRRLAVLEEGRQPNEAAEVVGADADADDAHGHDQANGVDQGWRPSRRRPGKFDAGVVTWRSSPTRNSPSAWRRPWRPSGNGCTLTAGKVPAALTGRRPPCGGGNWKSQ